VRRERPLTEVDWVFFDLDDTLVMDHGSAGAAFGHVCRMAATLCGVAPDALEQAARIRARQRWFALKERFDFLAKVAVSSWEALWVPFPDAEEPWTAIAEEIRRFRLGAWGDALGDCEHSESGLAQRLADEFISARRATHLVYPETHEVVAKVATRYPVGMITNGLPEAQKLKLEGAGLTGRFTPFIASGAVGVAKPDPGIFRAALNYGSVAPGRAVMVGNSYGSDVVGAKAAGMVAVWVNRDRESHPEGPAPDHEIADLRELPALLGMRAEGVNGSGSTTVG
jgi:putative hydrolase of the HAD superfamily